MVLLFPKLSTLLIFLARFLCYSDGLESEYDYVIVGAGVAGSVIAARIAELTTSGDTVLVLETGADETANPLLQPSYFFRDSKFTHLYRNYFSQEGPNLNGRRLYHQSTKALGGGSTINAMVWTWGDARDYDLWTQKTGLEGWTYEDVVPYFKKIESYQGSDPTGARGHDGPVHVSIFKPNEVSLHAAASAAEEFGIPLLEDNNAGVHECSSILQRNIHGTTPVNSLRQSSWVSFLQPANHTLDNLVVQTGATVTKVVIDPVTLDAEGVELLLDGQCTFVRAKKEVVLSGGTHNSAKLLLLSGVGNSTELAEVGVTAVHHLPGVGHNMQDHVNPGSLIFFGPPREDYDGNLVAAYGRTGVVPDELTPDVEFGYIMGPTTEDKSKWNETPSIHMFYCLLLNSDAKGHVKLFNADPLADPIIESGFFRTKTDTKRVIQIFRRLYSWSSRMRKVMPLKEVTSGPYALHTSPASTDKEIMDQVRNQADTHWHISGTAVMGHPGDIMSVVDGHFRVHGISSLRVVDASVMPVIPNGHPMAAIMVMGERAAEWILAENSSNSSSRTHLDASSSDSDSDSDSADEVAP
ncbi:unnamed protein product [Chrysoparadoxa australica]